MSEKAINPKEVDTNHSSQYERLSLTEKSTLDNWIREIVEPYRIKSFNGPSSYRLKHHFEYSHDGFYITNGAMKGAMLAAGFNPKEEQAINWTFQLSKKLSAVDFSNLAKW